MIERRERVLTDAALAGPQGRLLFAFLATRRNQAISKTQVIDAVWGTRTPPSAETTINAITSKLYSAFAPWAFPRRTAWQPKSACISSSCPKRGSTSSMRVRPSIVPKAHFAGTLLKKHGQTRMWPQRLHLNRFCHP
jgi:hypothetical protein